MPRDLVDQLTNAIGKVPPASALRLSRTEYAREIEKDNYHLFGQNYSVSDGKVILSAFHWTGSVEYVTNTQGELFDLLDSYGEPLQENDKIVGWIKGSYGIVVDLVKKRDDGYYHLLLVVLNLLE